MDKKALSERDICTKFITPALRRAGCAGDGIQQAVDYAQALSVPFVFSSHGDGFVFHERTAINPPIETTLSLNEFPSPATLWSRYPEWKGLPPEADDIVLQDYYTDGSGKAPRYYQASAVNAATEAIATGQQRLLLVMGALVRFRSGRRVRDAFRRRRTRGVQFATGRCARM